MSDETQPPRPESADSGDSGRFEDLEALAGHVMDHYEAPYHRGHCPGVTHSLRRVSPLCGDSVSIELRLSPAGRIDQAWFDGDGCVISQSAASMLVQRVEGMAVEDARALAASEMLKLFGPGLSPDRQKCCLLAWRAFHGALDSPVVYDDPA
jgi:nitrogen fixation NifU-like protein